MAKPAVEKELDKAQKQLDMFESSVKEMTMDRLNEAPKADFEPQTKIAQKDLGNSKEIYLKPIKTIACREKFNEKFRSKYEFAKEYVNFIAENHEIVGERIEIWTRPFPGMPAEFWEVPVNKPIYGPRYLAEQIKRKCYHRLTMQNNTYDQGSMGTFYGTMAVDTTVPRLDARPVSSRKSIFV